MVLNVAAWHWKPITFNTSSGGMLRSQQVALPTHTHPLTLSFACCHELFQQLFCDDLKFTTVLEYCLQAGHMFTKPLLLGSGCFAPKWWRFVPAVSASQTNWEFELGVLVLKTHIRRHAYHYQHSRHWYHCHPFHHGYGWFL